MRGVALALILFGCATTPSSGDAGSDASVVRTATLTSDVFALPGPGLRLSDGTILPAGMGDVWLAQRSTATISVGAPLGLCDVGTFASLAQVPTTLDACLGPAPSDTSFLSSNQNGTNQWSGRAWLIVDDVNSAVPTPIYRARAITDSDDNPHIVMTLEYEPI
jgi:hypothetical protein